MRFQLVDRILEVEPGRRIKAVKKLTLGEEYLADHFPTFPVMPGVLMLQSLVEAGAWLWRVSDEFRHSVVVLREARDVKYGQFMQPGMTMTLAVELENEAEARAAFKGRGEVEGSPNVTARFVLERYNLADRDPSSRPVDERLVAHFRALYALLTQCGTPAKVSVA